MERIKEFGILTNLIDIDGKWFSIFFTPMAGVPPPLFISTLDAVKQYSTQISDRYYDEVLIMIPISGVELF